MLRPHLLVLLLLAGAARSTDCRFTSGPDGLCAAFRLEPSRVSLRQGDSLRIRVNGGLDCDSRGLRLRWQSSAPEVASVDSTGLVRAERSGVAEIRLESDDAASPTGAGTTVVVSR